MEKKKKLLEPIRRGASSLPPDFMEALKKTGIPRNRLQIDLGDSEGDIGTETVWYGNKIVDTKKIKGHEKDS